MTWAASLGLFAWGGHALDQKVGTSPLFLLVGCALGGFGGFLHFLRTLAPEVLPWGRPKEQHSGSPNSSSSSSSPRSTPSAAQGGTQEDPEPGGEAPRRDPPSS